jgi:hypothetical protein
MLAVHCDKVTIVFDTSQIKLYSAKSADSIIFNKFTKANIEDQIARKTDLFI